MNLIAKIEYKNKNLETIHSCEYSLKDYLEMLSLDLKRIITDIEDLAYLINGNTIKEDWNEAELIMFNKIRSKILDKAGEIGRLSENIYDADTCRNTASSFWDELFNRKER